jgi:phage gpG-like protein
MTPTVVDFSDVTRGLRLMFFRSQDLRDVFAELKPHLKDDIAAHFAEKEGPEGGWAPRAKSTQDRTSASRRQKIKPRATWAKVGKTKTAKRTVKRPLQLLGRFRGIGAYQFHVEPQQLTMNAKGPWAGVQQFGGTVAHGAKIPARPFLWMSETFVEAFRAALLRHILSGWAQ